MQDKLFRPDIYEVAPQLYWGKVYWINGNLPAKSRSEMNDIKDPPCSGWSHCFLIDKGNKRVTLFCPYSLKSYEVTRNSLELRSMSKDLDYCPSEDPKRRGSFDSIGFKPFYNEYKNRLVSSLHKTWQTYTKLNMSGADFDTAAVVLQLLNEEVPLKISTSTENKVTGGKEVAKGLLKPVKSSGMRGRVLAFFLPTTKSIREAMAEFDTTRSNILSHLYMLQKEHGIGYKLANDAAIISLPENCIDPFC